MDTSVFRQKPFYLDDAAIAWVESTFASLSLEEKLGQLLLPMARDLSPAVLDDYLRLKLGGVFRFTGVPAEGLRQAADYLQGKSRIPMLMPGDLEFGEGSAIGQTGTQLPNQLAVAATASPLWAERMGQVAAKEGRYCGFNWSFTPVVDVNFNFKSPIVNTRSFGSSPERVLQMGEAYVRGMQAGGMAACVKHWPGDGVDDRDQHLVTSVNRFDMERWGQTYGRIYQTLVDGGVKTIMSAHIALPAYHPGSEAHLPATLSKALNLDLLRGEMGFNGLIVSDASEMGGFSSQGNRAETVPLCIENGCDILLFPRGVERDLEHLHRGLERGLLSETRLGEAVLRILALKASLGLHLGSALPESPDGLFATPEYRAWETECAESVITLVRDTQNLFPLSPEKHRRLLIIRQPQRRGVIHPLSALKVPEYLRELGFEVTIFTPETVVDPEQYDALLYLIAEEGALVKNSLHLRWDELHGNFMRAMERYWDVLPTAFISLGTPYYLYEVPLCKTFVNAYSPVDPVQKALVKALTGQIPFRGNSPVDAEAGLEDYHLAGGNFKI